MPSLVRATLILKNDFRLELRSKFGVNSVFAFVATALFISVFLLNATELSSKAQAGLLWLILLFASLSSLSRSFLSEADRHTDLLLRLHTDALSVFVGKYLFNLIFTLLFAGATVFLFVILLAIDAKSLGLLMVATVLGSTGLTAVSTLMAALVSKTSQRGSLFSVLCMPLLVPLILLSGKLTAAALSGGDILLHLNEISALIGFSGATLTVSVLLFETIWEA
jgi:heme exporter protein B